MNPLNTEASTTFFKIKLRINYKNNLFVIFKISKQKELYLMVF